MADLNRKVMPRVALVDGVNTSRLSEEPFLPFDVDMIVEDGQRIELGAGSYRASAGNAGTHPGPHELLHA